MSDICKTKDNAVCYCRAITIFWIMAVLMMFFELGATALWGSEDRWAEITRIMLLKNDWFHPCINGEIYFDKPLLSYWLIAIPGALFDTLNEFIVRLPGALAGLAGLWGTFLLADKLWDRKTAIFSSWLLLTTYGFVFWARKGAADMENMSAIILAVAWYFHCRDKAGFWSYLLFGLICVLGAHTKGLPAIAVPVVAILPDLVRNKNWKKHLKWQAFAAVAVCLVLYVVPFVTAAMVSLPPGWEYPETFDALKMPAWAQPYKKELCGLYLVWKENVMRFFKPFDHKEPFYAYFIHVPRILLPWTVLFVAALAATAISYKKQDTRTRWLLEAIILIFLLFSASGSRRWYYILPIMPFCSVLVAVFIFSDLRENWKKWLYYLHKYALIVTGAAFAIAIPVNLAAHAIFRSASGSKHKLLIKLASFEQAQFSYWWLALVTILGFTALLPWFIYRSKPEKFNWLIGSDKRRWAPVLLSGGIAIFCIFCVFPSMIEPFRTEKPLAGQLASMMSTRGLTKANLAIYRKPSTKVIFYMAGDGVVEVVNKPEEIANVLDKQPAPKLVLCQYRYAEDFKRKLPQTARATKILAERRFPWEKPKKKIMIFEISKTEE